MLQGRRIFFFAAGLLISAVLVILVATHLQTNPTLSQADQIAQAENSVVLVEVYSSVSPTRIKWTSGFIISSDYVITSSRQIADLPTEYSIIVEENSLFGPSKHQALIIERYGEFALLKTKSILSNRRLIPTPRASLQLSERVYIVGYKQDGRVEVINGWAEHYTEPSFDIKADYVSSDPNKAGRELSNTFIGSPVLNRNGHVIGMITSCGYTILAKFIPNYIIELLKGS